MANDGSTLYLLTRRYPFGAGETFVASELPYLAETFGRVVLVPLWRDQTVREIPPQIEIDERLCDRLASAGGKAVRYLLNTVRPSGFLSELLAHPMVPFRPSGIAQLTAFIDQAQMTRRWLDEGVRRDAIDLKRSVFYSYWLGSQTYGVGLAKAQNANIHLVSRAHGGDVYPDQHPSNYLPLQRRCLAAVDRLFCISEDGKRHLCDRFKALAEARCEVSRLGVPAGHISQEPSPGSDPRANKTIRLVSCSAMIPLKRVDLIVRALSAFARSFPDQAIDWTHLGDGPDRAAVQSLATQELGESDVQATFLGQLSHGKVQRFFEDHAPDLFIHLSRSEGVPVSMMEAQSHGVPILATDVGGVREIVNEKNGHLFPADIPDLADHVAGALHSLATDPDQLAALAAASFASWRDRFDAGRNYPRFATQLRAMLDDR